jgi:Leucine-rich repeat (LRR) protein
LILIVSSLDKLRNVRLNNLVQLELTIKGDRLASDPDIFKLMPKFSGSSPLTLYSRYRIGRERGDQAIFLNPPPTSSYLHLKGSNLTDISALGSAKGLIKLEIEGSKIQDIRALGVLTNLKSLRIYSPKLSNIEPLKSLTNLKTFGMSYSKVSDISVLRSQVNLEVLTLNQNLISDITPLTSLTTYGSLIFREGDQIAREGVYKSR